MCFCLFVFVMLKIIEEINYALNCEHGPGFVSL